MKKYVTFLAVVIMCICLGLLTGCGSSDKDGAKGSDKKSEAIKGYGDVYHDKEAVKRAVSDMKKTAGDPLLVFQNLIFSPDFISFSRQDNAKPDNVDKFTWSPGNGWSKPAPVKITGDGDMKDNVFNADEINWEAIPDFIAQVENAAKEKGLENPKLQNLLVQLLVRSGKIRYSIRVETDRKEASAYGDVKTGKLTEFKVN